MLASWIGPLKRLRPHVCARLWHVLAALVLSLAWQLAQAAESQVDITHPRPAWLPQTMEQLKRLQAGGGEPIGVMFPDIGEPFRKNFSEIIDGIEDQTHLHAHAYPLTADTTAAELNAAIKRNGTRVMVALGGRGQKLAAGLDVPVVLSAIYSLPEGDKQLGISFSPDPALLFTHMKSLLPGLKRVIVISNPSNSDWQVKLAREAARGLGLELQAFEARDLATAAHLYEQQFSAADAKHDAFWLPHDSTTVEEQTLMPLILKESWNRAVPVFSSSFLHVKKGALFALYPNNVELGRNLAGLALTALNGDSKRGMSPLRDVLTALNIRTATHMGISLSTRQQRSFDFLYPEP